MEQNSRKHRRPFRHHSHGNMIGNFCTALICKIPVLIVCGIVFGDCYIAFGFSRIILQQIIGYGLTWILLLIFGICIAFLLTSYFRCMLTSCAVKDNPAPINYDISKIPSCNKCGNLKPPRTHHCSICNTCTLKMDHHCPWVGNCVGLHNYKFFLIFLFWVSISSALYGLLTGIAMFTGFDDFGSGVSVWTLLSMFITVSFCLSVGGFFFFHVQLLRENKTTIENIKYGRNGVSPYKNKTSGDSFRDIFGDNPYLWFVPVVKLVETGYETFDDSVETSLLQNDVNDENNQDNTNNININNNNNTNQNDLTAINIQ